LPTIDASDFWDYCYSNENETLRAEYSEDVTRHVDKKTIIDFARRHPEIRAKYLTDVESKTGVAYDFSIDSAGLYNWYSAAQEYVRKHPQQLGFGTDAEFQRFVQELIRVFRHYVEENQGWKLLSNDDKTPRHEPATQTLFLGVVKHYCKANNIDFSREANIGRGPVDFKVASGYTRRALVEVKKADNTRFWHGLLKQLPKYLQAEEVRVGCFVVIVYNDADVRQIAEIDKAVSMLNGKLPYEIQVEVVDASYGPPSASKL
jgi:hypothetical protein